MDADAIEVAVQPARGEGQVHAETVRIRFSRRLTERAQVRQEVVLMHQRARATLGA